MGKQVRYVIPRSKERLDKLVVERGLCKSRAQAQAIILAGNILVDGCAVRKAGTPVRKSARITLVEPPRFVSRGGTKLDKAIASFGLDPKNKTCLDIGSSTGGFVDCLLQHGAAKIYAVDSGSNQLHPSIKGNPKVLVREKTNARHLSPTLFKEPIDLITMDVSFISIRTIIRQLVSIFKRQNIDLVSLVKPQFEAGKKHIPKGGVLRKPEVHLETLTTIAAECKSMNAPLANATPSPITGRKGNIEYLFHLKINPTEAPSSMQEQLAKIVEEAFGTFVWEADSAG